MSCTRLGPVRSAGEPASHHRQSWTAQLPDGTRPTGDRHQNGFRPSGDLWSRAVTPIQVGRRKAYTSGKVPPRQLRAEYCVTQNAAQPLSRNLAWQTKRASDVLMVDGDIQQCKPAPEGRGQSPWPQMSPQPVEELFGTERCEFVDTHLIDVNKPGADGTAEHALQTDTIEAHYVRDHVPHPPALTQGGRLPLLGRQSRQKIGKVGPLGGRHLENVHFTTSQVHILVLKRGISRQEL